eukprot:1726684-Pyramimonas_sp.AAC.1
MPGPDAHIEPYDLDRADAERWEALGIRGWNYFPSDITTSGSQVETPHTHTHTSTTREVGGE